MTDRQHQHCSWAEVQAWGAANGFGFLAEHESVEAWTHGWVPPQVLRDMHGEFRGAPLHKEARFDALLERNRAAIEDGTFPLADDIRTPWLDKPAIIVERDPASGEMYVADGEKRTLNACFNSESEIEAYIVDLAQGRGRVDLAT